MPRQIVGASDAIRINRAGCAGGGGSGALKTCSGSRTVAGFALAAQHAARNGVLPIAHRRFSTPRETPPFVMRGLDPRIHPLRTTLPNGWIAGSSPAMTEQM